MIDLVGYRFGMRVVVKELPRRFTPSKPYGTRVFLTKCDCGSALHPVQYPALARGFGCGCVAKQVTRARSTTHGMSGTAEFMCWSDMKRRCNDPTRPQFKDYGARGVSVCKAWDTFEQFFADMGLRPGPEYSLDRIDNDGNYCKTNCRWATKVEQQRNKATNRVLVYRGESKTLAGWVEHLNIPRSLVSDRLNKFGWSVEDALEVPAGMTRAECGEVLV